MQLCFKIKENAVVCELVYEDLEFTMVTPSTFLIISHP